jgi:hypothetical protein
MNNDRDRGILSPADRASLRGETDFGSVQAERNARARIRDRAYDGLLDFEVLVEHLAERDLELIFEKRIEAGGTEAFDALVSTVSFLYRGIDRTDLDFETVLREGINLAEAENERGARVDFEVTYHSLTVEELRRKLRRGESLSLTEVAFLHDSEAVGRDELAEHFAEDPEVDDGRIQSKVTDF